MSPGLHPEILQGRGGIRWVKHELLEPGQTVEGLVIALKDDLRVRNALSVIDNVRFMT